MPFRFDKLTIKAQEAVARAQEMAAEAGNPQIEPLHLLASLLREEGDGIVRPVLEKIGANVTQLERIVEAELKHLPKSSGGSPPGLSSQLQKVLDAAQTEADRMKDEFVSTEHLLLALDAYDVQSAGRTGAQRHHQGQAAWRAASRARKHARDRPNSRRQVPGAGKVRHRSHRARPAGQARPGDRPRQGNPPRDPGAVAAHEEQPRAHRRAGRRQDGHRRRAGHAHRAGRRAREPQEPPRRGARHGRADRRHEVPRRIRRAAQGAASRKSSTPATSSCSSTSCTRSSAPARPKAAATRRTCSSRRSRAASCAASARRRSTSIASTSRRTRRWSGGSSRCTSASRTSRTRSPFCAA